MNRTGNTGKQLGLYSTQCCGFEMLFDDGDTFCRCPKCSVLCEWEMLEIVIAWTELEQEERVAA